MSLACVLVVSCGSMELSFTSDCSFLFLYFFEKLIRQRNTHYLVSDIEEERERDSKRVLNSLFGSFTLKLEESKSVRILIEWVNQSE